MAYFFFHTQNKNEYKCFFSVRCVSTKITNRQHFSEVCCIHKHTHKHVGKKTLPFLPLFIRIHSHFMFVSHYSCKISFEIYVLWPKSDTCIVCMQRHNNNSNNKLNGLPVISLFGRPTVYWFCGRLFAISPSCFYFFFTQCTCNVSVCTRLYHQLILLTVLRTLCALLFLTWYLL